jgi:hypothetical protein
MMVALVPEIGIVADVRWTARAVPNPFSREKSYVDAI